jgi:hypothetical protein
MHIPTWVLRLLVVGVFLVVAAVRRRRQTPTVPRPGPVGRVGKAPGAAPQPPDAISNKPLVPR